MVDCTFTAQDVRDITGSDLVDSVIQPFMDAACCILNRVDSCLESKGVSAECVNQAGVWLSAHLLSLSPLGKAQKIKKKETFENYSVEYAISSFSGQGISLTTYGQTANTITGGCLVEADKQQANICFFG